MNCKNCIKVNPLPKCVETDGVIIIDNILLTTALNTEVFALLHNYSSDATTMWNATIDGTGNIIETNGVATSGLDITDAYDLMNHHYSLEFLDKITMESLEITIDGQVGCCIDFFVQKGIKGDGVYTISTNGCNV
jgi:hypothetical protein